MMHITRIAFCSQTYIYVVGLIVHVTDLKSEVPDHRSCGIQVKLTTMSGEWPKNFVETVMVPVQKVIAVNRTIGLMLHASEIMLKILTQRIDGKAEAIQLMGEDQFGFKRRKGTRDAIGVLRAQ